MTSVTPPARRVLAIVLAAALAVLAAACGSANGGGGADPAPASAAAFPAGSTMARLHAAGAVTIGVKFDQPGLGQMNPATGKPEGFDIETGKIIAAALGIPATKIKWVESVSANRETFLSNGTVDLVIASYSITEQRKQKVSFAGPYYVTGQQLLVRHDSSINSTADLAGKKVCSASGSTALATVQHQIPAAKAIPFATYTECVQQLVNGSVDAVSTDGSILLGYAAREPDKLKVVGAPFSVENYGIGLKKDDSAFRGFLNDTLQKAFSDGSWAAAFAHTLGKSGAPTPTPPALQRY